MPKLPLISDPIAILAVLAGVASFFFFLEKQTAWKIFGFFPPLIFIYTIPAVFSNVGVITNKSPLYDWMSSLVLPLFLVLLLLKVDVKSAFRVMGRGVFVMLLGTLGVVIGAPLAYLIVKHSLSPESWRGFGALAGSWIGGTGNMAAVAEAIETSGSDFGLAVIADNAVYLIWLPIMLGSRNLARWFHRFTGVSESRLAGLQEAAESLKSDEGAPAMRHYLYLIFLGLLVTAIGSGLSGLVPDGLRLLRNISPQFPWLISVQQEIWRIFIEMPVSAWRILLITTFGIVLSFTPARRIPGSHALAMALVYLFVANMGARANLQDIAGQAVWFLLGGFIWIFIHGGFILAAARVFKIDVHTAAIASAANIGGAASAPVVAAYHNRALVPVSVLMASVGYAIGNYAALLAAFLCRAVA
jgi:uncharacterized membrane protein